MKWMMIDASLIAPAPIRRQEVAEETASQEESQR